MDYFWDTYDTVKSGVGFSRFGLIHICWLVFFCAVVAAFCISYRHSQSTARQRMKYSVTCLLIASELFKQIALIALGEWSVKYLPLHLCSINIIIIFIHSLKPFKTLSNYLYCVCLPATLFALVFPGWTELPLLNFIHIQSFVSHILLALYPLLLIAGNEVKRDSRKIPECLLLMLVLALPVMYINKECGTNFMFLSFAPSGTPLIWFKQVFGSHLVGFPVITAIVFTVIYLPFKKRSK